jgi:hypothetical protein|tara:strand:+ start:4142 stop:4366 length:225 start_codon:yes stop_codon:yes gene_type:complete
MEYINEIMRWIIAPVAAFVWFIYMRQQKNTTDIAVLKAQLQHYQTANDREIKEMRETVKGIYAKLDNLEQYLRK